MTVAGPRWMWMALPAALGLAACATPPDPDGHRTGARQLPLSQWRADELWCDPDRLWSKKGDCGDWLELEVADRGAVRIEVESSSGRLVAVSVHDPHGGRLDSVYTGTDGSADLRFDPSSSRYYVAVEPAGMEDRRATYRVRAVQEPPPPPPPQEPRFQSVKGAILEVERGRGGERTVVIDLGQPGGVRVGQRGRLVDGGNEIVEIEIVEVYPDGSRARLEGTPASRITPQTEALIDVPVTDLQPQPTDPSSTVPPFADPP